MNNKYMARVVYESIKMMVNLLLIQLHFNQQPSGRRHTQLICNWNQVLNHWLERFGSRWTEFGRPLVGATWPAYPQTRPTFLLYKIISNLAGIMVKLTSNAESLCARSNFSKRFYLERQRGRQEGQNGRRSCQIFFLLLDGQADWCIGDLHRKRERRIG